MKKQREDKNFIINNKGSALISVVVSMLFVIALGVALLFTAYTGFRVKVAERGDNKNFYNAETVLEEIRAGIQGDVTRAIASSYTKTMEDYLSDADPQNTFKTGFQDSFISELFNSSMPAATPVDGKAVYYCDIDIIKGFVKNVVTSVSDSADYALINKNKTNFKVTVDKNEHTVTLEAISVEYYSAKGYQSNITTDLVILPPPFYAISATPSKLTNYSIIANNALSQSQAAGKRTVKGDVFVGKDGITVDKSNNGIKLTGGNVVCKGPITISNGGFEFDSSSNELWAGEIRVGTTKNGNLGSTRGIATLNGKIYVADDLVISGDKTSNEQSNVTLKGTYFGFGNGLKAEESSSIIVNSRGTKLDVSGLERLSLAGVSFIDAMVGVEPDSRSWLQMGESVSLKSNQLVYLVPAECIETYSSNPCVIDSNNTEPKIDVTKTIWEVNGIPKSISDYGSTKLIHKNLGGGQDGQILTYVFMTFESQEKANEYFSDYFAAHPDMIEQYTDLYVDMSDTAARIRASGNSFFKDGKTATEAGSLELVPGSTDGWSSSTLQTFNSASSPYELINKDAISKLSGALEFKKYDEVVARVINGNYEIKFGENAKLIIASGNITVSSKYQGTVIAGGNVYINADVEAPTDGIDASIFSATAADGTALSEFIGNSLATGGAISGGSNDWDPKTLVVYSNWKKS